MWDALNTWLTQPSCFLVSSPLDISNFTFALPLVLVDLPVHMYSVQSARYLQISSSAWSACLRSLRASRDFCLISILFAPNTRLTTSTSLRLLPCQFLLHLFLVTFLCCCFCASFGVPRSQITVPACWLNSLVLSYLFLIMFSCSSRCSSWRPPCTTSYISWCAFGPNLPLHLSQLDPVSRHWLSSPWLFCQFSLVILLWLLSPWSICQIVSCHFLWLLSPWSFYQLSPVILL